MGTIMTMEHRVQVASYIPHVVYLVVDHPCNLSHHFAPPIEHRPEDFRCHDEARGAGIDGDIARH